LAHQHDDKHGEKVVYVGDSRVVKRAQRPVPRDYSAYPGKSEAFVPNFLLKEWMVGAVVLVGFMVLVISHPAPLGYPADPTNTQFIPMPDWYFLFLYQLLKYPYTSEGFKVLGTIGIPAIAFGSLLLAPFLDTGKERRFYRRPVASGLMLLSLAAIFYLTYVSWDHYQHELETRGITPEHILKHEDVLQGIETEIPGRGGGGSSSAASIPIVEEGHDGYAIYQKATCVNCHGNQLEGVGGVMPALRGVGDKYSKDEIMSIIQNGTGTMPAQYDDNIGKGLTPEELDTLAEWLAMQKKG